MTVTHCCTVGRSHTGAVCIPGTGEGFTSERDRSDPGELVGC